MTNKYICIHGHFYQPPRENPWLEEVETEESAAPFHDWNERITSECYAPNTASRVLEGGKILSIVNNYEKISFNFGPTLFLWLEKHKPEVYRAIIDADRKSCKARNGHGNAIAQVYNHSIMPLNSRRDKETQIIWGIRDFEYRFGRKPEGIWFAETAVDRESLLIAARHGIKFTVLAPGQAKKVRPAGQGDEWETVNGSPDTTRPYIYRPDDETSIALFFYDGELATEIAFKGALNNGVKMGRDCIKRLENGGDGARLVHAATDGESYGHHHRFGEMALSAAIRVIESDEEVLLTNYGEYLASHPPDMEADIHDNSSWSCAHGVERWKSDCGCHIGGKHGWNQKWRGPLRDSVANLKEKLDMVYEDGISRYTESPWEARNEYINVVLDRSEEALDSFFKKHLPDASSPQKRIDAMKYLEIQRNAMRMFTSCGWFFDDVSGLETVQVLKYAAKAMDIEQEVSITPLEEKFLEDISKGQSNIKKHGNGADIYNKKVLPLRADIRRVTAFKVIREALRKSNGNETSIYHFNLETVDKHREDYLDTKFLIGRLRLASTLTLEKRELVYCLLHFGGHDFSCFVRHFTDLEIYSAMKEELCGIFSRHSIPEMVRAVEAHFGGSYFMLKDLLDDERRKIMPLLVADRIDQFGSAYESLFERNRKLMDYFSDIKVPMPEEFKIAAQYVYEKRLNGLFVGSTPAEDVGEMKRLMKDIGKWGIQLNYRILQKHITSVLERNIELLCSGGDCSSASLIIQIMEQVKRHKIEIDLWKIQNMLYPFVKAWNDPDNPQHGMVASTQEFKTVFKTFGFYIPEQITAHPSMNSG